MSGDRPRGLTWEERKAKAILDDCAPELLEAVKIAYRKHHLGDDTIGWDELSEKLMIVLCEAMGDEAFQAWMEEVKPL